jgi:hypothetical protein
MHFAAWSYLQTFWNINVRSWIERVWEQSTEAGLWTDEGLVIWRKLRIEQVHNMYSRNILERWNQGGWGGGGLRMGDVTYVYRIVDRKSERLL